MNPHEKSTRWPSVKWRNCRSGFTLLSILAFAIGSSVAQAQIVPWYSLAFDDAVTGDNAFIASDGQRYWTVDAGADRYQNEVYERPTIQTYQIIDTNYASKEYFGYLDIVQAKFGFDTQFLYIAIDLYSLDNGTSDGKDSPKGLGERYGVRLSLDPDGRNGIYFYSDQPAFKNGTEFGLSGNFGFMDTDGDVGGAATGAPGKGAAGPTGLWVTKSDNPEEVVGLNGYDQVIISDGKIHGNSAPVLYSRIDPADPTIIEFAFLYSAVGLSESNISVLVTNGYLSFEAIKGDPKDPQNSLWNDRYTSEEAGSPNGGPDGLSEFGTQGLGNLYESDTLQAIGELGIPLGNFTATVPVEPGSAAPEAHGMASIKCIAKKGKQTGRFVLLADAVPPNCVLSIQVNGAAVASVKSNKKGKVLVRKLPVTNLTAVQCVSLVDAQGNTVATARFRP